MLLLELGAAAAARCFAARCFHFFSGGSATTEPTIADGSASTEWDVSLNLAAACMQHNIASFPRKFSSVVFAIRG